MKKQARDRMEKVALDADLRGFLKDCLSCQSPAISAWAARILKAKAMTTQDLKRCLNLGFEF